MTFFARKALSWSCLSQMLGVPQVGEWEGLESLPEYGKIRGWRSGFPSKSMLREVCVEHDAQFCNFLFVSFVLNQYVTTNLKIGGSSRAKVSPDALDLLEKLLALGMFCDMSPLSD